MSNPSSLRRALSSTTRRTHTPCVGQRFGDWWVRAELEDGWLEVVCLACRRTYERNRLSVVTGESKRCNTCSVSRRSA